MEKSVTCPIDGHICERAECRLFSEEPSCKSSASVQAENIVLLFEASPSLEIDLDLEKNRTEKLLKHRARVLGVDYEKYIQEIAANVAAIKTLDNLK